MKYILILLVMIYTISCQEIEQQRLERLIDKYQGLIDKYHKRLAEINNTDTIKIGSWNIPEPVYEQSNR